jgi:hypothetical protein
VASKKLIDATLEEDRKALESSATN